MTALAYTLAVVMLLVLVGFAGLILLGNLKAAADREALAWAIIDPEGRVVSSARFDDAEPFAHGLAAVELDGRWGYVDRSGEIVISPSFTRARPFDAEGRAAVATGAHYGVIDRSGALVHPAELTRCGPFDGGAAVAAMVVEVRASTTNLRSAGLMRADGSWVVEPALRADPGRWLTARGPRDGLVAAQLADKRWGLFDLEGAPVGEARFEELGVPGGGLIPAREQGRWGYVDGAGAWVIRPRWLQAQTFSEDLAVVKGEDGYHLIDRAGEVRAGPLTWIGSVSEGLAAAQGDQGWGFIDAAGRWVVAPTWLDVGKEGFREGRARVARGGVHREREWAWIDRQGQVIDGWHAEITPFSDGRALARLPR